MVSPVLRDAGQRRTEFQHAIILRLVPHFAPARVIAVLLAAARISTARLKVSMGKLADPYLGPGGRNREGPDPREHGLVLHPRVLPVDIDEARPSHSAVDTGTRIADITQLGGLGRFF